MILLVLLIVDNFLIFIWFCYQCSLYLTNLSVFPSVFKINYLFYFWLLWILVTGCGLLTAVASPVAEHRPQAPELQ